MVTDKFTYARAESCLYEAMRMRLKNGRVEPERERKAIIHPELTHLNTTYFHPCLTPLTDHAPGKGYVRGKAIAEYHNSQVSNKYQGAKINGDEDKQSKAMGTIITLPKDYLDELIPNLTDEEYEYLTNKLEAEGNHKPFAKDEAFEASLKEKFTTLNLNEENIPKIESFLLAAKDCVLEEMGIRKEDVLFYSIHLDESFPHIHLMALPTCEKVYDKDVYSERVKKDGTRTLLHKKGDRDITYSISRFFDEKDKEGKYTFFYDSHPHVIERMAEKGFDASGLLNGVTSGKGFNPDDLPREYREKSVEQSRMILALEKKNKQLEADMEAMQTEFDEKKAEFTAELKESLKEVAKANRERDDIAAELEYMQIEKQSLSESLKSLSSSLKKLTDDIFGFIPRLVRELIKEWKSFRYKADREAFEADLEAKATSKG